MRWREVVRLLAGAAIAWPLVGYAQEQAVIGFLHQGSPEQPPMINAFRQGLADAGIEQGSFTIEQRSANGQYDKLPELAADFVNRGAAVIAADFLPAALAAEGATKTVPIVFLNGSDPIKAAIEHDLPSCHSFKETVAAGGLVSLGPDLVAMAQQAAVYVDKIIHGARPAELPVQRPARYELHLNVKTAKALQITIPDTLLTRADEVIE